MDYDLYAPIVGIVRNYCKIYYYAETVSKDPREPANLRAHYKAVHTAIKAALEVNCRPDEAPFFVSDIGLGTGFNKSQMCFISEVDYKVRKRKIVHDIAVGLNLIQPKAEIEERS